MMLNEIKSKCSAELIASRDHDAIAAAVNVGRTKVVQTLGGIGTIMETLGPDAGAALLDTLDQMALTDSAVKWAFFLIKTGNFDFGSSASRGKIDELLPNAAGAALKAVAEQPDSITEYDVRCALYAADGSFLG